MKCVCGYEKYEDYEFQYKIEEWEKQKEEFIEKNFPLENLPKKPVNGDEDWIYSNTSMNFQLEQPGYGYTGNSNLTIYACPKCGTLKINIGEI